MGLEHTGQTALQRPPDHLPGASIRCCWASDGKAFARSLASLAGGGGHRLDIELHTGERAGPLAAGEVAHAIDHGTGAWLLITAPNHAEPWARIALPTFLDIELQVTVGSDDVWWLQATLDLPVDPPVLGLPAVADALSVSGLHGLIGLAVRNGLESAELMVHGRLAGKWSRLSGAGRVPVAQEAGAPVWRTGPAENAELFFEDVASERLAFDALALRARLHELLVDASDLDAVGPVLVSTLGLGFPITVVRTATSAGAASLVPGASAVTLELGEDLVADAVVDSVLFAAGHLALGHIAPGDPRGHSDTLAEVRDPKPLRAWDREVRELLGESAPGARRRKVEKLEDCTPEEKACLGLWRMIGEVLGESQRLHDEADRYQAAMYQRQAAQRLLAQLEEYRGAMLCDGVGLGKTYVATTLLVHYANWWRERLRDSDGSNLQDRFRVAVLTPQSVVSTWRREALPALAGFGVNLADIRVISHAKLSRITSSSEVLDGDGRNESDLEHLLLADLVVVDEAHNFRSISARRTRVLRDLLRLQPRRDERRRVLLLTATPINNSLDDLMQEVSLLFSRPLPWLHDSNDAETYRKNAQKVVRERCVKARTGKGITGDVSAYIIHGKQDAKFAEALELRDDLKLGPRIADIGKYLKEQDTKLKRLQESTRAKAQSGHADDDSAPDDRVAEDLLDRIVVQRSRDLCKAIEKEQGTGVELLFRRNAEPPEALPYADAYDDTKDVLASLLPLFDVPGEAESPGEKSKLKPLTLKVYMWFDVREGLKSADDVSSVVGLQRALILKRLESSPVSFLITLLRLTVLHAHHLQRLHDLCSDAGDKEKVLELRKDMEDLKTIDIADLRKVRLLVTGDAKGDPREKFFRVVSALHHRDGVADTDDAPPPQLKLFDEPEGEKPNRVIVDRLWGLKDALLQDARTLLQVTPRLATIIFGKFAVDEWPKRLATRDDDVDWPTSSDWGQRIVSDPKVRKLVERLLGARRHGQKTIVFSQFSDTLSYIQSVLRACKTFDRKDWSTVTRGLDDDHVDEDQLRSLIDRTTMVTGAHADRDSVINAFAPFYRLGPTPPPSSGVLDEAAAAWEAGWRSAIESPIEVLLATDVLAEGVNLQDAALLINYDVHWNPVRMIQRAGRIDRRLKPDIEKATDFPIIEELARSLGKVAPRYYFTGRSDEPPTTVNMILPDELERELLLRERLALKTLAIDFTLGLERGTGAEADWMDEYKYQGISSLNAFQRDRAVEQIASYFKRLTRMLDDRCIQTAWSAELSAWLRAKSARDDAPLIARGVIGRHEGEFASYVRYLRPVLDGGHAFVLWTDDKSTASDLFNFWLELDRETWPAPTRQGLSGQPDASLPLGPGHLLFAVQQVLDHDLPLIDETDVRGEQLLQLLPAVAAGTFRRDEERAQLGASTIVVLQLPTFQPVARRGIATTCPVCGVGPGMHKCCTPCGATATGEREIEKVFGFRVSATDGVPFEIPQPWCRSCRARRPARAEAAE